MLVDPSAGENIPRPDTMSEAFVSEITGAGAAVLAAFSSVPANAMVGALTVNTIAAARTKDKNFFFIGFLSFFP